MEPTLIAETAVILGFVNAVLVELLKVFPALGNSGERKGLVAFITAFVVAFTYLLSTGTYTLDDLVNLAIVSLGISYLAYKTVVKPVIDPILGRFIAPALGKFFTHG